MKQNSSKDSNGFQKAAEKTNESNETVQSATKAKHRKILDALDLALVSSGLNLVFSALQEPQPSVHPLINNTLTLVCGPNQISVPMRAHFNCYENCQNKDQVRPCLGINFPGPFCDCKEGFIFRNGTTGDCIKREDCPK
ncbi:hypothetical protein TYRP_005331 [Tyrophagus putrescentiae]|nr:hypothetical protein TYRP_005331 [Tyrophagus putrescentiae]